MISAPRPKENIILNNFILKRLRGGKSRVIAWKRLFFSKLFRLSKCHLWDIQIVCRMRELENQVLPCLGLKKSILKCQNMKMALTGNWVLFVLSFCKAYLLLNKMDQMN